MFEKEKKSEGNENKMLSGLSLSPSRQGLLNTQLTFGYNVYPLRFSYQGYNEQGGFVRH